MKKTILTTTLALGLGVSGMAAGPNAEAADNDINKEELAEMALAESGELDAAPLHEGAYHYNFNINNVDYNFESDGINYSWAYNGYNNEQPQKTEETQINEQTEEEVSVQETAPEVVEEQPQQQSENVQPVESEQQAEQSEQQAEDTQAAAPAQNTQPSTDGSTKEQFLDAGGTEAMWETIVMPESSGDPEAVNELGYRGLGQTRESWGTGSVEEQTEGMINYAEERYGSVEEAMQFREQNDWW